MQMMPIDRRNEMDVRDIQKAAERPTTQKGAFNLFTVLRFSNVKCFHLTTMTTTMTFTTTNLQQYMLVTELMNLTRKRAKANERDRKEKSNNLRDYIHSFFDHFQTASPPFC